MAIRNIELLFPGDSLVVPAENPPGIRFIVDDLGDGRFQIIGLDSEVYQVDSDTFTLNSSRVTDNGDGTFSATSA